jgi:hypothetical protein
MSPGRTADGGARERRVTVVRVRAAGDDREVMFAESARIYRLLRGNPAFTRALRQLSAAARSGRPLRVRLTEAHGDVIEDVNEDR